MGTTSEKLTYLNTTKGKIKDSINLTNANILSTDTFRSYATKLKNGLVDIINNGTDTLYDNFPKVTAEGTEIALNNTYEAPMKLDYYGDTQQDSYSGKNLLKNAESTINLEGVEIQILNNGTKFIFNGTAATRKTTVIDATTIIPTSLLGNTYSISMTPSNNTNSYIFWVGYVDTNNTNHNTLPSMGTGDLTGNIKIENKTFPNDAAKYRTVVGVASGQVYNNFVLEVQIEKNASATSYEPYVGGIASPNPDYPQNINVVTGTQDVEVAGKNLLNYDDNTNYKKEYLDGSGNFVASSLNFINETINAKPNTIYTTTYNQKYGTAYIRIGEFKSNGTFIKRILITDNNYSFTTSNECSYIIASIEKQITGNSFGYYTNLQLEMNNQATTYEPYKNATYEVNLGKNLFDKDNANILNYYMTSTGTIGSSANDKLLYIKCKPNTTYTMQKILGSSGRLRIGAFTNIPNVGDTPNVFVNKDNNTTGTITTGLNDNYLVVQYYASDTDEQAILNSIQIEEGSIATSYASYFTPIELCKIGNYQDIIFKNTTNSVYYDNTLTLNAWYKKASIGKVALDGSENWIQASTQYSNLYSATFQKNDMLGSVSSNLLYSDNFKSNLYETQTQGITKNNNNQYLIIRIDNNVANTINDFKTWLSTHNTIVYYVLNTPTYTEITNTTLINQLETIKKSYEDKTYINVSGNLPMIINASALEKE